MFEELAGEDLLILDDLRSHREVVERLRKEDEDNSRLLLAGMLRKEETFSRRELVDFARRLGIEVVTTDDQGTGTARTRKLKELEKAKEQRDAMERECHIEEVKKPSRKSSKKPRSSGPRWDLSFNHSEPEEDEETSCQELAIEYDEPKRKMTRRSSKVSPLNKTDAATSVARPLTRSSRQGEDKEKFVKPAVVPKTRVDRKIKPLPKRAKLVPIENGPRSGAIELTPQRIRFLESLAEVPILYHPNGKVRNLKADERKSFLQEDEWTASVSQFSVKCKACGENRGLDRRSPTGYDTSLWIKHRKKCRPMYAAWLKKNGERDDAFES